MSAVEKFAPLVARILLGLLFVWAGLGKIPGFTGTAGYIASKGLPLPQLLAAAAIALEVGGGLLLIIGWQARWAALALALFCLFTAVVFHDFWAAPADQARNQTIHFMKNLAIAGGMLMVFLHGSGPASSRRSLR